MSANELVLENIRFLEGVGGQNFGKGKFFEGRLFAQPSSKPECGIDHDQSGSRFAGK